ncbi:hypothetical protein V8D89_014721 [Ganoderma adspersum]
MSPKMTNLTDWPLPPDIEFIIIDYFLDDKPTLASCSLVCSRWLPPSRKHLFKDITIKETNHHPLADFLHIAEPNVPERNPTVTCPLSVLRALLSTLPHLASLCVTKFLILDDTPQKPNAEQCHPSAFELDELSVSQCSGPTKDPHPLSALICTFSSIGSLSVDRWGQWQPNPLPTFSLALLTPPVVRSLTVDLVKDAVAAHTLYALLANSPSVTDSCLTRLSVHAEDFDHVVLFTSFVNLAGAGLRDVALRVKDAEIRPQLLSGIPLTTCTALSSLALSFECLCNESDMEDAEDTRDALGLYTAILRAHRNVFVGLTTVRLEMRPIGGSMLNAFVRVAQNAYRERQEEALRTVPPPEADENRMIWEFLEDALCEFPALDRVELVLYETSRPGDTLTEAAKVELRSALAGRLPRLWPRGTAQLVFETFVHDP